ncbi:MAG TPA: DUF3089 domain-containing protein [Gaiellaceae bacterium]|jgi:pimeloyl-ACP methyl ester carboxylesterase|nr:DUF3089 domain-containing protein [Gaiellaceae bacterium]
MRRRAPIVLAITAAGLLALAGCGSHTATTTRTVTTTTAKPPAAAGTLWLCFPGRAGDPCSGNLATTVIRADGSRSIQKPKPAADPPIDCFYVYPTVSNEKTGNAPLQVDLPLLFVAQAQAERFSQVCKVYAPVYRQVTNPALTDPSLHPNDQEAYGDVLAAWRDYLAHDNHGRGVVLIGHSQGAYILKHLVKTVIDRSPAERRLLVSAILLGGQVLGANTPADSGDFAHVPTCSSPSATGCVIAYSSFDRKPPPGAMFGRDASPATHVLCVNPSAPGTAATRPVTPLFPTALMSLVGATGNVTAKTPWVAFPDQYTARCARSGTASWLQITQTHVPGDKRPVVHAMLGPGWGLHLTDVNIALADLVGVVGSESRAFTKPGAKHSSG